ncbi:MAG: hypothetical protein ACFFDD_09985, partial [Promethearchaeota archaeon]
MHESPPYWTSPDKGEFEVSIESVWSTADYFHVRIDKDVIRPAGGGQAGEKGQLIIGNQEVSVIDTVTSSDGTVLVTEVPLVEGETGLLKIDLLWRTSLMRNHTAEHIFVALIKRKFEDIVVGELWIDGRHGLVELLGTELDLDSIFETESEVMKVIEDDLSVESGFEASDSIDSSVRIREGLFEKHDQLRIVSVGDMDVSACSGIHVSRTGEIGFFKVLDVKKSENKTRVEFAAGMEVAHHISRFYNEALRRKYTYPFEMEQLGSVLDRAKSAIDDKQKMIEKTTQLLSRGPTVERI